MILGSIAHQGSDPFGRRPTGHAAAVPHGLKLNQLRYVLSAAEQGSFRRAAAVLNIQQSTVSRRIRELEDRLGAAIFERDAAGVHLTRAGGQFLERARQAVEHLAEAADAVETAGRAERAVLRIGVIQPLGQGFLEALFARLVAQRTPSAFVLREEAPEAHRAALATRGLDVAFLPEGADPRGLAVQPLWREALVVAMRLDHALAARAALSWPDLAGESLLVANDPFGREIAARLAGRVRPDLGGGQPAHAASLETLLRLAALGQGLVVLGGSQAGGLPPGLVCRPIADAEIGFGAVWSPRNEKLALRRALRLALELSGQPPYPSAPRAERAQSRDPSP